MEDRQREFIQVVYLSEEEATASVARDQNHLPLQTVTESGIPIRVPYNPDGYSTYANDLSQLRTISVETWKGSITASPTLRHHFKQRKLQLSEIARNIPLSWKNLRKLPWTHSQINETGAETGSADLSGEDATESAASNTRRRRSLKISEKLTIKSDRLSITRFGIRNTMFEGSNGIEGITDIEGASYDNSLTVNSSRGVHDLLYRWYKHAVRQNNTNQTFEELLQQATTIAAGSGQPKIASIITINVSGQLFQIDESKLRTLPDTLLGNEGIRVRYFVPEKNCLFFNRCRRSFEEIFGYYLHNRIKRPSSVSLDAFIAEMKFFELGQTLISEILKQEKAYRCRKTENKRPVNSRYSRFAELLHEPMSSLPALLVFLVTLAVNIYLIFHNTVLVNNFSSEHEHRIIFVVDVVLNILLMFVFLVRFVISESKNEFILTMYAIIDLFNIFVFIATSIAYQAGYLGFVNRSAMNALARVLQLLRVFQLLKFPRSNITGALGKALRSSSVEIISIFLVITVLAVFFGVFTYFMEAASIGKNRSDEILIRSIGDGIWFSIVTITTVGYGDMYPVTRGGRLCAVVCAYFGQVIMSMLIPIVSVLYQEYYDGKILSTKVYKRFANSIRRQSSIALSQGQRSCDVIVAVDSTDEPASISADLDQR